MKCPLPVLAFLVLASLPAGAGGALAAAAHTQEPVPVAARPDKKTAAVFERITLEVDLNPACAQRLDPRVVLVGADVHPPSGNAWLAPGFLYQPFTRKLEGGAERLEPAGPPRWQVRLALVEPGPHRVHVLAGDAHGDHVLRPALDLVATKADAPGYVRRAPDDFRYFATDRGETFFPIGANVCWAGRGGTFDYDRWLPKYAAQGCNYWRAWLSPFWTTFGLNTARSGYDRVDPAQAWRLDQAMELSERLGLRVLLCIDSFNILKSSRGQHGSWEQSPYTRKNGGPCERPQDYFTNADMLRAYRDRLRYLVARWGCSPSVFAWEFWNEVDIIDDYPSEIVTRWHQEMAQYLRKTDPWRHLLTTSTANPRGDPRLDALAELQFVQSHHYAAGDVVAWLDRDRLGKAAARDRPHYHGEFGLDAGGSSREADPGGICVHDALYASVGQEHAAAPMSWYWDNYIEPQNLYPAYGSFARWVAGFDFAREKPRRLQAEILYADAASAAIPDRAPLVPTEGSWEPAPFNAPAAVTVDRFGKLSCDRPLARVMHGLGGHKRLHNPVTFDLDAPAATTFGVRVDGVSGWSGARLVVTLDGKTALDQDFPDPDPQSTATLNQYKKTYRIDLPAGRHTVKVENTGNDWFEVGYEIPWRVEGPPLRAYGLVGRTRALVWVQNRHHRWDRAAAAAPTVSGARLVMTVPPGAWTVERWDTQKGEVTASERRTVGADGRLALDIPPISWDAAFRLRLEPPPATK